MAVTATTPKPEKADYRDKVFGGQSMETSFAARWGIYNRFAYRQSVNAYVEEAAYC